MNEPTGTAVRVTLATCPLKLCVHHHRATELGMTVYRPDPRNRSRACGLNISDVLTRGVPPRYCESSGIKRAITVGNGGRVGAVRRITR